MDMDMPRGNKRDIMHNKKHIGMEAIMGRR